MQQPVRIKGLRWGFSAFEKAVRPDSQNSRVFINSKYAYNVTGETQKYTWIIPVSRSSKIKDAEARNNLFVTLYENKQFAEALVKYRMIISKFPD